jgi:hypothetical protein
MAQTDQDSVYHAPRAPDWLWLGIFALVVLGCGAWVWAQLGSDSEAGRAVFFGAALLALLWATLIYTFKLSVSVSVGPRGLSLARGPWRTELPWAEVGRLVERAKVSNGQRFRWLVALARDGRELRIREDMVSHYERFRVEVYERYRLWEDHGGTWGTTFGGPFTATDDVFNLIVWWLIGAAATVLPGLYFALLIPDGLILGLTLIFCALLCVVMAARARLNQQIYTVNGQEVSARRLLGMTTLPWVDVMRVERARSPARLLYRLGILLGHVLLLLAARADSRVESFAWAPRVPEFLVIRGMGYQIRVNLHLLARPDELLAWIEFYEQVARQALRPQTGAPAYQLPPQQQPADLTGASGPLDPWGAGRGGDLAAKGSQPPTSQPGARVTKKFTDPDYDEIDPRIRAVMQDQAPSQPPSVYQESYRQGHGGGPASGEISGGLAPAGRRAAERDPDEEQTAEMPAAADKETAEEWQERQDWSEWSRPPLPRYGPTRDNRPTHEGDR